MTVVGREVHTRDHAERDDPVIARVRLVGGVAVESDTDRIDDGVVVAARGRRILAALVDAPGGVTARRLAERVWAEPPATWPSALRGAIATVRKALDPIGLGGAAMIATTTSGWTLSPGVTTDLADAESALSRADAALAAGTTGAALALRDELRGFLDGSLLADDDAEWLDGLRERHRRAVDGARRVIAEAAILAVRPELAVEQADALLAVSPVDETAHRIRIRARRAAGDRAGAVEAYERCRSVLAEQLGIDPAPETTALYLEALQSGSAGSGELPPLPADGFFGWAADLTAVLAALAEPGAVQLIGRGGVGKSRLALHAAHELAASAEGGRYWASIGDLAADELVPAAVAEAVGAPTTGGVLPAIIERLAPAGPAVLVLDGCEEVADGVVELATALREAVPGLRLLLTTRIPLGAGIPRIALGPLATSGDDVGRSPAVRLIVDRVAARGGRILLDGRNAAAVEELCARCEGIPLALELAAAQLTGMAVGDLLDELSGAAEGAGGVLETMVDQARAALDAEEVAVIDRLALIDGRVPLAVVRGLVSSAVPAGRTARLLAELGDSGLLTVNRTGARWRYGLDDELRRLIRRRAPAPPDAYPGLAAVLDGIAPRDATVSPADFRDAVDDAADGFRTLFRAAAEGDADRVAALDLAYRLHRYWTVTRVTEGRYWLGRLLDGAPAGAETARARFAAGYLGYWMSDPASLPLLRRAAEELSDEAPAVAARALIYAAGLADDVDRPGEARRDILASVELARRTGDGRLIAAATIGVGAILAERGDPAAVASCEEGLAAIDPAGPIEIRQAMLANCARLAWQVGDLATARRWADESLALLDGPARIAKAQLASTIAALDLDTGRLDPALEHAQTAVAVATELELERELPLVLAILARVRLARGERAAAEDDAIACLEAARSAGAEWAAAIALETAAAVIGTSPVAGDLLRTAGVLRRAGDRQAPVTLRIPAPAEDATEPAADALTTAQAVDAARDALR